MPGVWDRSGKTREQLAVGVFTNYDELLTRIFALSGGTSANE
jgi:hypothetical protein